ncbi:hypothetical protein BaRGS_00024285 [Batillaria attramentaria]|uniref:Fucolectin-related molecule n=1 Tax=Batillaria attramentaria TaxID=370345 RepID=A0ABD0KBR3_9CAEN
MKGILCAGLFTLVVLTARTNGYETNGNLAREVKHGEGVVQGDATLAVDGNRRTRLQCSSLTGHNPELHVGLGGTFNVAFIIIYNDMLKGTSSGNSLRGFKLTVGEETCYSDETTDGDMEEMIVAVCGNVISGSQVTITLPGPPEQNRTLSVCELEVYENAALGRKTESSLLEEISGPSSVVVNGNSRTTYVTQKDADDVNLHNCIRTADVPTDTADTTGETSHWWQVDLGRVIPVSAVVIYRTNPVSLWRSRSTTEITVDGRKCATYGWESHHRNEAHRQRLVVRCENVVRGRFVRIARIRASLTKGLFPLQLCEVQVWASNVVFSRFACLATDDVQCVNVAGTGLTAKRGCAAGWFSPLCDRRCLSSRCVGGRCNQVTGYCDECQPNWAPPQCEVCRAGYYGSSCGLQCGRCADNSPCDIANGNCTAGCEIGWVPPLCTSEVVTKGENNSGSNGGAVAGAVLGSLFGIVLVAGIIIFLVIFLRRRHGQLRTQSSIKSPGGSVTGNSGKPDAAKTESFTYTDAISARKNSKPADSDSVTRDVTHDDVISEPTYESLTSYENMNGDHVYTTPSFHRQESEHSNTSGTNHYVNLGASVNS